MNKNYVYAVRTVGFLPLLFIFMFVFLSLILFGYLPPLEGYRRLVIYFTNYIGMILGAFLCPRCLPLPWGRSKEKPPVFGMAYIIIAVLPNLVIRSLGVDFWLGSLPAEILMAISSGMLITIAHGLFFLTRLSGGDSGAGRWTALLFAIAITAGASAPHYLKFLLNWHSVDPAAIPSLLFRILKWMAAGIAIFTSASVWLLRKRLEAEPAAAEVSDKSGAPVTDWSKIIGMFVIICAWDFLNSLLISGKLYLLSNPGWAYLDLIPWAALAVLALAFFAGRSPDRLLHACLPPAIALFILMPALTLFREYTLLIKIILLLVSIADLTLWFMFSVIMAESCRNRTWFYACAVGGFISSFFGGFGQVLGPVVSGGVGFTAVLMAVAAVVFVFLGFRLLFPKAAGAILERPSLLPVDRERVFAEHGLSRREIEVARLMAEGLGNDAIGTKLHLSNPAIRYHIRNIYNKFGIDGRHSGRAGFMAKVLGAAQQTPDDA